MDPLHRVIRCTVAARPRPRGARPAPVLPHQPAPPHPTHNSITSTTRRRIIAEDPALVEKKVSYQVPELPQKPDLPRSFRSPEYHRTLAYHDAHRQHCGTRPPTQERAQSAISRPPEPA